MSLIECSLTLSGGFWLGFFVFGLTEPALMRRL